MGVGVSIFLFAVGAILAFAVDATTEGVNLDIVGVILMLVGGIGLLVSMVFWGNAPAYGREERPYRRDERRVTHVIDREAR